MLRYLSQETVCEPDRPDTSKLYSCEKQGDNCILKIKEIDKNNDEGMWSCRLCKLTLQSDWMHLKCQLPNSNFFHSFCRQVWFPRPHRPGWVVYEVPATTGSTDQHVWHQPEVIHCWRYALHRGIRISGISGVKTSMVYWRFVQLLPYTLSLVWSWSMKIEWIPSWNLFWSGIGPV